MWATPSPGGLMAACFTLPILSIISVGLRFYTRRKQQVAVLADDWTILFSLVFTLILAVSLLTGVFLHTLGYPITADPTENELAFTGRQIKISTQLQWMSMTFQSPALGLIKLSFLFFYKRIFCSNSGASKFFSRTLVATMWFVGLWAIAYFIAFLFACRGHFNAWWGSPMETLTKCVNTMALLYSLAITDFIQDVIIIFLPLPMIWSLHMGRNQKIGVTLVFLLGLVAVAASLTRLIYTAWVRKYSFDPSVDLILLISGSMFWPLLEAGLATIAACLPTLHFLFKNVSLEEITGSLFKIISRTSLRAPSDASNERLDVMIESKFSIRSERSRASPARVGSTRETH